MAQESKGPRPRDSVKVAVFDIDGTITDCRRALVLECVEAIRELQESGVVCMIVSGNVLPVAMGVASAAGIRGPVVGENGGMIHYEGQVTRLRDSRVAFQAFENLRSAMEVREIVTNRWREVEVGILPEVPLEEVQDHIRGFDVWAGSTGFAHHIMPTGVDKATGLSAALEMLGLGPEDCVAFGDHQTDIPMMEMAALSGAPAQAEPEVRAIATWVAEREYGHGTADLIREHLL